MKALFVADFAVKLIISFFAVTIVTAGFTRYQEFLIPICSTVFMSLESISWISRKTTEQRFKRNNDRLNNGINH